MPHVYGSEIQRNHICKKALEKKEEANQMLLLFFYCPWPFLLCNSLIVIYGKGKGLTGSLEVELLGLPHLQDFAIFPVYIKEIFLVV